MKSDISRSSLGQYELENSGLYSKVNVGQGLTESGVVDNIDLYLVP